MNFILGYIAGLITSGLIFIVLAFFRAGIERKIKIIETKAAAAGPKPKGYVYIPKEEADEKRAEYLKKNRALGKDTPLSEL